jgi:hypothetical protein
MGAALPAADIEGRAGWLPRTGPLGLWLLAPVGWRLVADGPQQFTVSEPSGLAAARVRQRELPFESDLADWLWQHYPGTEPGLHQVRMRRIEALPACAACAVFDYGSAVSPARASVLALRDGARARVFVAAAAQPLHAAMLPVLVRILDSCRPCPGGLPPAARRALLAHLLRLGAQIADS